MLSNEAKRQISIADGLLKLLEHIKLKIPSLLYLEDIVALFENPALEKNGFLVELKDKKSVLPFNERFERALWVFEDDPELYLCLKEFSKEFGALDLERQQKSLSLCADELKALLQNRRASYSSKEKCYKSLGALLGIMITIIML